MKKYLILLMMIMFFIPLFSQSLEDIEGVWTGDRGLGNVYLYSDGTGYLTFTHDTELRMNIRVRVQGNGYVIEQAEQNRWEFYTYALPPAVAREAQNRLRPMVWELRLNSNGEALEGRKLTSSIEWDSDTMEITSYSNETVRNAQWNRLEGTVSAGFEPLVAEDNNIHVEVFNIERKGDKIVVQFNVTNLDHRDRDYSLYHHSQRIIDQGGRTWTDVEYVVVGSERGNTWAGTTLVQDVPIFNEFAFEELPNDIQEIKVLEIGGNLFSVRFRDVPFN